MLKDIFEEAKKECGVVRSRNGYSREYLEDTGFCNVRRVKCNTCTQGYIWIYRNDNGEVISRVNFLELRKIVIDRGWAWKVEDRFYALKTSKLVGLPLYDLK